MELPALDSSLAQALVVADILEVTSQNISVHLSQSINRLISVCVCVTETDQLSNK